MCVCFVFHLENFLFHLFERNISLQKEQEELRTKFLFPHHSDAACRKKEPDLFQFDFRRHFCIEAIKNDFHLDPDSFAFDKKPICHCCMLSIYFSSLLNGSYCLAVKCSRRER